MSALSRVRLNPGSWEGVSCNFRRGRQQVGIDLAGDGLESPGQHVLIDSPTLNVDLQDVRLSSLRTGGHFRTTLPIEVAGASPWFQFGLGAYSRIARALVLTTSAGVTTTSQDVG